MTVSNIQLSSVSKAFTRLADWAALAFAAPHYALWRMEQDGYQADLEHEVESHFAISNGFLGCAPRRSGRRSPLGRASSSPACSTPRPARCRPRGSCPGQTGCDSRFLLRASRSRWTPARRLRIAGRGGAGLTSCNAQ
jgi:hypothetical protein